MYNRNQAVLGTSRPAAIRKLQFDHYNRSLFRDPSAWSDPDLRQGTSATRVHGHAETAMSFTYPLL